MKDLEAMESFLNTRLRAVAPSGVRVAPGPVPIQLGTERNIIYEVLSARDLTTDGINPVYTTFIVKVVGVAVGENIQPVADLSRLIHQALQKTRETNAYGHVFSCYRDSIFRMPARSEKTGQIYQQLGGIYRIRARGSA